jgi:hypothetical protein
MLVVTLSKGATSNNYNGSCIVMVLFYSWSLGSLCLSVVFSKSHSLTQRLVERPYVYDYDAGACETQSVCNMKCIIVVLC